MDAWGLTHSGKIRNVNQDVYKIIIDDDAKFAILVICDGMGGANAGNIASPLAAETFTGYIMHRKTEIIGDTPLDDIADTVADAAAAANRAVYDHAASDIACSGMGTTLVALVSTETGEVIANIGDSRAYYITPNGISQITKDHSVVEDMIDRGEITRLQAQHHPRKNLITRAVGADMYTEPDIYSQVIDSGEYVLLCSDGLSNVLSEDEIAACLENTSSLREACESMLDLTLERGAPDNVTIAVFRK